MWKDLAHRHENMAPQDQSHRSHRPHPSSRKPYAHPTDRPALRPRLVSPANFVVATRDTGYRSTPQAIAELIDNSIQAGATSVRVEVLNSQDDRYPIEIVVIDDGHGMDAVPLASALTFGGSTRFGECHSLGRY